MTENSEPASPQVEIVAAAPDEESVLANLLEFYAYDFSEFLNLNLGENGRFGYDSLPLYWTEAGRHPFFIRVDGKLAGMVLVKKGSEVSGDPKVWDVAEFFIVRGCRKQGAGSLAAHQIWRRFPGPWEVRVRQRNAAALQSWTKAVSTFAGEAIQARPFEKDGDQWSLFSFRSEPVEAIHHPQGDIHR